MGQEQHSFATRLPPFVHGAAFGCTLLALPHEVRQKTVIATGPQNSSVSEFPRPAAGSSHGGPHWPVPLALGDHPVHLPRSRSWRRLPCVPISLEPRVEERCISFVAPSFATLETQPHPSYALVLPNSDTGSAMDDCAWSARRSSDGHEHCVAPPRGVRWSGHALDGAVLFCLNPGS